MSDTEFIPAETVRCMLRRWWLLPLLAFLGGVLGWSIHFFRAPVYEATASLLITMDFDERELTQYEMDYAFSAAGGIIESGTVQDQLVARARAAGIQISAEELSRDSVAEGRQSVWELHVLHHEPQVAAELANLWAQVALEELNTALGHASLADQLEQQTNLLEACLPFPPGVEAPEAYPRPAPKECARYTLAEIQTLVQDWQAQQENERVLSLGLLSSFSFSVNDLAEPPASPRNYDLAGMTLAGALIGLVISLWVSGAPGRRARA